MTKTVRDVMTTDIIWLSPDNKVKTAIILMKGRSIGCLPVMDEESVVGVIYYQDILGRDTEVPVQHIMNREFVTVPPLMPVPDAADLMTKIGNGRLLVMEGNKLVGIVTRGDLLPELGKSLDPLTGLLRVDAMRDWGINALRSGQEITVIFVDMDRLRMFNKVYGHIIGDKAIKHIAMILSANVNAETDMLCRYAGDEFVVVTVRAHDEARALAAALEERLRSSQNADLPEPVTATVGIYGGKRTKEREQVHYEATLDSLINLASKSCTVAKSISDGSSAAGGVSVIAEVKQPEVVPAPQTLVTASPAHAPALTKEHTNGHWHLGIQALNLSWGVGETAVAEVEITDGSVTHKSSRSGYAAGNSALRLIADAAAEAVTKFLPSEGFAVTPENVHVVHSGGSEDIVLVTLLLITPQKQTRLSGSAIIKQDAYRATAAAVVDSIGKQIPTLI